MMVAVMIKYRCYEYVVSGRLSKQPLPCRATALGGGEPQSTYSE